MAEPYPIYIAHPDGRFLAHVTHDNGSTTSCGEVYADWPDIVGSDGSVWEGDKDWYSDHDRDDVQLCGKCIMAGI